MSTEHHHEEPNLSTTFSKEIDLDAAWDDLCVNPQRHALDLGISEGREAGLMAGFNEGRTVGIIKGVEYGMELGFLRGTVAVVSEGMVTGSLQVEPGQAERIEKTLSLLKPLLDNFPTPDEVFQSSKKNEARRDFVESQNDSEGNSTSSSPSDPERHIQDIRAKFKLLTIQLKWGSQFSLKTVMDAAAVTDVNEPKARGLLGGETTDW